MLHHTCLGANKSLAVQAASCIFSSSPPWPELVSYIRNHDFQSSSFSPLDRTSTTFSLYCDFSSTCCALRDSTWCILLRKRKVYASIQRVSEQFPNYPLINSFCRFQRGATCLGANKALAVQAASCIFSSPPPAPFGTVSELFVSK